MLYVRFHGNASIIYVFMYESFIDCNTILQILKAYIDTNKRTDIKANSVSRTGASTKCNQAQRKLVSDCDHETDKAAYLLKKKSTNT